MGIARPRGSDAAEVAGDLFVNYVGSGDACPNTLCGVAAGLTPLCLEPFDKGSVPEALLAARPKLPCVGGERDFARDLQDPATPSTCKNRQARR